MTRAASGGVSNSRTLAGHAMAVLQRRIVTGEYGPGHHLRIEELADELDMSSMPIREALQRLDNAGFVEYRPHRGARVVEPSASEILDIYTLRIPLESLAIRLAARRFTPADEEEARSWLKEYVRRSASDWRAREAQMEFHFALYRAAGSRWLMQMIEPLFQHSERYRFMALSSGTGRSRRKRHEELLQACVDHDEELAAQRLSETLLNTVTALSETLDSERGFSLEMMPLPVFVSNGAEPARA